MPLVVIDLKDPTEEAADLWAAIDQLRRYMRGAPDLFVANMMLVASDGLLTRVGSITSGRQRFMPWSPGTGGKPTLEALIRGLFEPAMANPTIVMVTDRNERGEAVKKVQDEAVPAMNGAFEKLRAFFHDFDTSER